jgi:large subunit ribosomal protein L24e
MKCSFCDGTIPKGRGKMVVRADGRVSYFCSSKCQRNSKLGRDGKSVKWTKRFRDRKKK